MPYLHERRIYLEELPEYGAYLYTYNEVEYQDIKHHNKRLEEDFKKNKHESVS